MGEWVYLCRVDEVPEGRGLSVEAAGARVAILRDGEAVAVLFDRCPHAGGSLGSGWVEDDEVVCPLHPWRVRLRDGRGSVPGPAAHVVERRGEAGEVWARLGPG